MNLLDTSDKVFWHNYLGFYERFFEGRDLRQIAEFGVFRGNSIRWLLERFPDATIYGADILPPQPSWPQDPRFHFTQLDQGDLKAVRGFLQQTPFDLIIEDGSHYPEHQVLCLLEGLKALAPGGLYLLEDIHTSHPHYSHSRFQSNPIYRHFKAMGRKGNALTVLLALQHYQRIGTEVTEEVAGRIAHNAIVSPEEVLFLAENLGLIELYRRSNLPDFCYKCNATDFDYSSLRCVCGVPLFSDSDSMSFALIKRTAPAARFEPSPSN